jgi:hypothetical protein
MENNLFSFVFNTIQKRANNPENQTYWLPKKIAEITDSSGEKLIPIHETGWDIGPVNRPLVTSIMVDQWKLKLGRDKATKKEYEAHHTVIPCPDNPLPILSFPVITIDGLQNLFVLGNPAVAGSPEGYKTKISLKFDDYNGQNGLPKLPRLLINGKYRIIQSLCTADKNIEHPTRCDGWQSVKIDGTGAIKATFSNIYVDAECNITTQGVGNNRKLRVNLTSLTIRDEAGKTLPGFILDPDNGLTIESNMWIAQAVWLQMAKNAIESPDGQQGIFQQLNASLNNRKHLDSLSQLFTHQLNNILNTIFGNVPAKGFPDEPGRPPANPVDRYIFDRVRAALNNPESEWFLPSIVYNSQNPSLEPLSIDIITLPDQTINIMGQSLLFTRIQLAGFAMAGTSNIIAPTPQLVCQEPGINVTASFSTLNPPPSVKTGTGELKQIPAPPLTATGKFSMLPDGETVPLPGSFAIAIQSSDIHITVQPSGTELDDLQIKITRLQFDIPPQRVAITMNIDSVFKKSVEKMINGPNIKTRIVSQLNAALEEKLADISQAATEAARQTIAARLDE